MTDKPGTPDPHLAWVGGARVIKLTPHSEEAEGGQWQASTLQQKAQARLRRTVPKVARDL
jgi:hypothetical protein